MGAETKIEWAHHTFNPWIGCTKVSPACASCYAERFGARKGVRWGKGQPRKRTAVSTWKQPLAWNRAVQQLIDGGYTPDRYAVRPRVFCASLADWLDDEVPAEWLADLLALVRATPALDWLMLTKRPQLWRPRLEAALAVALPGEEGLASFIGDWLDGKPPAHVWVGTTVEDQARADERIPRLVDIPARVRFLSCEPLLERIDLTRWVHDGVRPGVDVDIDGNTWPGGREPFVGAPPIGWIIAGGESGPRARPTHPDWLRSLRDQARAASVPFFFKQWGEWGPVRYLNERGLPMLNVGCDGRRETLIGEGGRAVNMRRVGKKAAGNFLDGEAHQAAPTSVVGPTAWGPRG